MEHPAYDVITETYRIFESGTEAELRAVCCGRKNMGFRWQRSRYCRFDFSIMYRVQYKNPKEWVFVCKECLLRVKNDNTAYKHGVLGRNKGQVHLLK